MPRKPKKTVDILANLEVMANNQSLPEAVRSEAAKEYVRLKAATSPAPKPAPTPTSVLYTESAIREAFKKIEIGTEAKPTAPPANPESESQEFAKEHRGPEPVEGESKPKPKPYVWRDERGRTTEMIKADMFREKQANSRAWAESMGLTTTRPEWPGV